MSKKVFRLLLLDEDEKNYHLIRDLLELVETCKFELDLAVDREPELETIAPIGYDAYLVESDLFTQRLIDRASPAAIIVLVNSAEAGVAAIEAGAADYIEIKHLSTPILEHSLRSSLARSIEQTNLFAQECNFLRTIIDCLPIAVVVKDVTENDFGSIKLWNKTCEAIFGITSSQAIDKTVRELFPPEEADFLDRLDREAFAKDKVEYTFQQQNSTRDGSERSFRTVKVPIYDENCQPKYLLCFAEDISSRYQAREQLNYRLALETALAMVSREFALDENVDLNSILHLLGTAVGASHAYLVEFRKDSDSELIHEWHDVEEETDISSARKWNLSSFSWWSERLKNDRSSIVSKIEELPEAARAEKEYSYTLNINAILAVPICDPSGEIWGEIGFNSRGKNRKFWSREDAQIMQIVGDTIYHYHLRQKAKAKILDSESLYSSIFNHSADGIFLVDVLPEDKFVYETINPSYQLATGLKKEDIAGKTPSEVLPKEVAAMVERFYRTCMATGKPISYEQTLELSGSNRIWRTKIIPIKDSTGNIVKLQGNSRDITEEKHSAAELLRFTRYQQLLASLTLKTRQTWKIEEILQTAVTELQKTFKADRVLFFKLFADGYAKVVNEAVVSGFPASIDLTIPDEVWKQSYPQKYLTRNIHICTDISSAEFELPHLELLQQYQVRAHLVVPIASGTIQTPSNHDSDFSLATFSANERVWGLLCVQQCSGPREWVHEEIRLLKQLADQLSVALYQAELVEKQTFQRQELARSNAELEHFAYVASHDLKAPLGTISGYAKLLESRYQEQLDARAKKYIHYITEEAKQMQKQIDDLLEYSRIGIEKKNFELTDCNQVFKRAIANLQLVIRKHQAVVISQDLPAIIADSSQLLQLFQNLIDNAIKYRRDDPPVIAIKAERQENGWLFCVSDNGIGISPEYSQRIFQIFQRLHTQDEYPGTGIGLAICQKIVEHHGGRIWVDSLPGRGSNFYFTFAEQME